MEDFAFAKFARPLFRSGLRATRLDAVNAMHLLEFDFIGPHTTHILVGITGDYCNEVATSALRVLKYVDLELIRPHAGALIAVLQKTFVHKRLALCDHLLHLVHKFDADTLAAHAPTLALCCVRKAAHTTVDIHVSAMKLLFRLPRAEFETHVAHHLSKALGSMSGEVCLVALGLMERKWSNGGESFATHANALVEKVVESADVDDRICADALLTLRNLSPSDLARSAHVVVDRLKSSNKGVVEAALWALCDLDPQVLATYAREVAAASGTHPCLALNTLTHLEPRALVEYAQVFMSRLEDPAPEIRRSAVNVFRKMGPDFITRHVDAVLARFGDDDCDVRKSAKEAFASLPPGTIANYAQKLLQMSQRPFPALAREAAMTALGWMDPSSLAELAVDVNARLGDSNQSVRTAVVCTLAKLGPSELARYETALVARLGDSACVREAVLKAMRNMDSAALARRADSIALMIRDSNYCVRYEALSLLATLPPHVVETHANAVADALGDPKWRVRYIAIEVLRTLVSKGLASCTDRIILVFKSPNPEARRSAVEAMGLLPPGALTQHADALVAMLGDYAIVRQAAFTVLARMHPALLAKHAVAILGAMKHRNAKVCQSAMHLIERLPNVVTRGIDAPPVFGRLLGRLAWLRVRYAFRVRAAALYWDSLPFRPGGAGFERSAREFSELGKRKRDD